ncbi:MAG: hypothetical protein SVV80_14410, partial [Planctomycetota bacterium]|nr:hypothetical protein [Planctomycetota bacterium]
MIIDIVYGARYGLVVLKISRNGMKEQIMLFRIIVFTLSVLVSTGAMAQTTRPAGQGLGGVVTGENVYVRSEPGNYPCTKLSHPERVLVTGRRDGWLEIMPPAGCFSLISKRFVSVAGNVGTVTGTNVLVRAGSSMELYRNRIDAVQTSLNIDDKVTIVGEQEGFYQITPPPGARLWIAAQFVKRLEDEADTQPATTQPTTQSVFITTTQPDVIKDELSAFEAAEKALEAEFKKPREVRNLPDLLAKYEAIKITADSPLAPYIKLRVDFLRGRMELARDVQDASDLVRAAEARQAGLAADRAQFAATAPTTRPTRSYAAEGILYASELFTGGATGPKRFLIRDTDTHLISAYVQCTTGAVELAGRVGAHVGVIGSPKYDEAMRLYIIEAEKIAVIKPAPPKPEPLPIPEPKPEPIITPVPEPKPEPKPEPIITPVPEPKPEPKPEPIITPVPEPKPEPKP